MCLNHHQAFDLGLIRVDPGTLAVCAVAAANLATLGVKSDSIRGLKALPHPDALRWAWDQHGDKEK
jgi:hypothetical protein